MKLENQVCTLAQAKRLKELGVCQESAFYFVGTSEADISADSLKIGTGYEWSDYPGYGLYPVQYSAFTVAELGLLLGNAQYGVYYRFDNIWYWHADFEMTPFGAYKTEAEAKAAILIYMLENKLMVDDFNQRLQNA